MPPSHKARDPIAGHPTRDTDNDPHRTTGVAITGFMGRK
jgi:hypothetical protein